MLLIGGGEFQFAHGVRQGWEFVQEVFDHAHVLHQSGFAVLVGAWAVGGVGGGCVAGLVVTTYLSSTLDLGDYVRRMFPRDDATAVSRVKGSSRTVDTVMGSMITFVGTFEDCNPRFCRSFKCDKCGLVERDTYRSFFYRRPGFSFFSACKMYGSLNSTSIIGAV